MWPSATVWPIDVFIIVFVFWDNSGALWHRGMRCIRVWLHRQYLLVDSNQCLFCNVCGICWRWEKYIISPYLFFKHNSKTKRQAGWQEVAEPDWAQTERPSEEVEHQHLCSASGAFLQPAWSNLLKFYLPINGPGPPSQAQSGTRGWPRHGHQGK